MAKSKSIFGKEKPKSIFAKNQNSVRAKEKMTSAAIRGMRENTGSNTVFSTGKGGGLRTERYPGKIISGTAKAKKKPVAPKPSTKIVKKIK